MSKQSHWDRFLSAFLAMALPLGFGLLWILMRCGRGVSPPTTAWADGSTINGTAEWSHQEHSRHRGVFRDPHP